MTHLVARRTTGWVGAGLAGAVVSVALGVYGSAHTPSGEAITTFGFGSLIDMKVWLASAVGVLAVAQLVLALWMFGRLRLRPVRHLGTVHRLVGLATVLLSLPVAYHCLYQLAFQDTTTRVLAHSLLGCLFYGAFATKVTLIHMPGRAGVWLPVIGGTVFALLVATWVTSGLWFITTSGIPSP